MQIGCLPLYHDWGSHLGPTEAYNPVPHIVSVLISSCMSAQFSGLLLTYYHTPDYSLDVMKRSQHHSALENRFSTHLNISVSLDQKPFKTRFLLHIFFLTTLSCCRYPLITHSWLSTRKRFLPLVLPLECSWLFVGLNTSIPITLFQHARVFITSTTQWVTTHLLCPHAFFSHRDNTFICHVNSFFPSFQTKRHFVCMVDMHLKMMALIAQKRLKLILQMNACSSYIKIHSFTAETCVQNPKRGLVSVANSLT